MKIRSQALIAGALAVTTAIPLVAQASSLSDQVKQYTRNDQNYVYVTQSVLGLADAAALGLSMKAYQALRPEFSEMARLRGDIRTLEVRERETRFLLDQAESGRITFRDDLGKNQVVQGMELQLQGLKNEKNRLSERMSRFPESGSNNDLEKVKVQTQTRIDELRGEIRGRSAMLKAIGAIKPALSLEQTVAALNGELKAVQSNLQKSRATLSKVKGNIITRATKSGLRLAATATGLIAITDLGSRAYIVFIEKADPGTFPVLEMGARLYDENRTEIDQFRKQIEDTVKKAKDLGSLILEGVDFSNLPNAPVNR